MRRTAERSAGLSIRLKLTLSYAGFLLLAGALLLAAVWVFLLRYVPRGGTVIVHQTHIFESPGRGALLRDFFPAAATSLLLLLLFGLLGGWFLAGKMLAPVTRITDAVREARDGSLSHRIRLSGSRDELRELADTFDVMLARLEAHDAEQRRFAANASHELRTPLAITQTILDVARNKPTFDAHELVERLYLVNARAIDLTEALLVLSRINQQTFEREAVDLSLVVDEAAETLLPLAEKFCVSIETAVEAVFVVGSRALLMQLVVNLVHNAIVHNLTEGGSVWVTAIERAGRVALAVENTGVDLSPELLPTLIEPFSRGAGRIHGDRPGVGLGLAIVKSVVDAHAGTLELVARTDGGLRIVVELPREVR